MEGIIIVFCLTAAASGLVLEKNFFNPITAFFGYWAFVVYLLSLKILPVNQTSDRALIIILIGLISFYMGCLAVTLIKRRVLPKENQPKIDLDSYCLRYKLVYAIYGITLIYLLYNSLTTVELLRDGNTLAQIRKLYTSRDEYNVVRSSPINVVFKNFISTPVVYISLPVMAVDFLSGKKNKIILLMTLAMTSLWIFISGGRSLVIWLMLYFATGILIYLKRFNISRKTKKYIIIAVGILFAALILVSNLRRAEFSLLRELFVYFAVPIPHFDYRIDVLDKLHSSVYGYGISSINGFIYPVLFVLEKFGVPYPEGYLVIRHLSFEALEEVVDIGVRMNAFATMFYTFYLDGRYLGVIMGSGIFGAFCTWVYYRVKQTMNSRAVVLYLFLMQKLLFSVVRFYFFQPAHAIGLGLILLFYKKNPSNKKTLEEKRSELKV